MREPTFADAFQVLLLQAADEGRGPVLFGESMQRARAAAQPFMVGQKCPDIYFEFPLVGSPFLDVTTLYGSIDVGTRVDSIAAAGTGRMLDWYAQAREAHGDACCGFELDTKHEGLPAAAIHFQPRNHHDLVEPFCEAVGEPERAKLYLDIASRLPEGWPLSFFGMFRGRPDSPLRVCGYLGANERAACAEDSKRLADVFDAVGFSAYDQCMLEQATRLLSIDSPGADFQFDVFNDGTVGDTFAFDIQFDIEQPQAVLESFRSGTASQVIGLFREWGIDDGRSAMAAQAAFARSIAVELDDGTSGRYAFTLMPQWVKVRWIAGTLQPAKLYLLGNAGILASTSQ